MKRFHISRKNQPSTLAMGLELFIVACIFFSLLLIPLEILFPKYHRLFWRLGDNSRDIDNRTLLKVIAVYGRNSTVPMVAELQTEEALAAAEVLDGVEFLVGRHFGERLASQAVLNPGVTTIYDALMTFSGDPCEFYTVPVPEHLLGKSFRDAQSFLGKEQPAFEDLFGLHEEVKNTSPPATEHLRAWAAGDLSPARRRHGI